MERLLRPAIERGTVDSAPGLPFVHAVCHMEWSGGVSVTEAAAATQERYHAMLLAAGVGTGTTAAGTTPARAYNLIVTRRWMLLVPRSRGRFQSISVNSLGFAGSLLVRDESELALVKNRGPMNVLRHVAMPVGAV
jgi:ATP adenylyltransferase